MNIMDIGKGLAAMTLLLAAYILLLTTLNGPTHAMESLQRNGFLLFPLTLLFGGQITLYSFAKRMQQNNSHIMASGGMTAGSMAACCAHHALDVIPILGISGLSMILSNYEQAFLGLGILSGLYGMLNLLSVLDKAGLIRQIIPITTTNEVYPYE